MTTSSKAFLIGGGIGSLAAAAFMIRDGGMRGAQITVFESAPVLGGSLDGGGNASDGYVLRGGRMLTTDNYECTWNLFKSIPSIHREGMSVFDETVAFNQHYQAHSMARLVDKRRARVDVVSMGFSMQDRVELLRLSSTDEIDMAASCITDWLSPAFFDTEFWSMWATTFAFQPWHSAVEFKRYLHRFMLEFSRIDTLAGIKRTVYNQYDSLVLPLQSWLAEQGVTMLTDCTVRELLHSSVDGRLQISGMNTGCNGNAGHIVVGTDDVVILQNGSMTDASTLGSMHSAPAQRSKDDSNGWILWEDLAKERPQFGRPAVFNSCIAQSCWESFTITLKSPLFFEAMQRFSGNEAGTGGLVTFKDSNWLMSIVLAHQPHFAEQPPDVTVCWGYALFPDRVGNFVAKPMEECSGADLLQEVRGHLRFDRDVFAMANCIPCRMPYITSMFMPRLRSDRPPPVPADTKNLAFASQFVEIPEDVVFTVEYSIRAAQMAVYALLGLDCPIPVVTSHDKSLPVQIAALIKAFK